MNPYQLLKINRNASKGMIIQAVATAMREKEHSAQELVQAQKMLFDPVSRAVNEFINFTGIEPVLSKINLKDLIDMTQQEPAPLKRLSVFDEQE